MGSLINWIFKPNTRASNRQFGEASDPRISFSRGDQTLPTGRFGQPQKWQYEVDPEIRTGS